MRFVVNGKMLAAIKLQLFTDRFWIQQARFINGTSKEYMRATVTAIR